MDELTCCTQEGGARVGVSLSFVLAGESPASAENQEPCYCFFLGYPTPTAPCLFSLGPNMCSSPCGAGTMMSRLHIASCGLESVSLVESVSLSPSGWSNFSQKQGAGSSNGCVAALYISFLFHSLTVGELIYFVSIARIIEIVSTLKTVMIRWVSAV